MKEMKRRFVTGLLAAGASYGPDTANLTVPSGATATTALLYLDYGTGKQRIAVIIG